MKLSEVLIKPIVTEKSNKLSDAAQHVCFPCSTEKQISWRLKKRLKIFTV